MKEEKFFEKLKEIHGDSIRVVSYDDLKDKSEVLCNCEIHGNFKATVHNLVHHKVGCPYCRLHNSKSPYKTTEQLVYKLRLKYGDKFSYDKVVMGGNTIILTCHIHGDFEVGIQYALKKDAVCPICKYETHRQHYHPPVRTRKPRKTINKKRQENPIPYSKWNNMFIRCYNKKYKEKIPTYEGCYVCEEWRSFDNFLVSGRISGFFGKTPEAYSGKTDCLAERQKYADLFQVDDFASAYIRLDNGVVLDFRIAWYMHLDTPGDTIIMGKKGSLRIPSTDCWNGTVGGAMKIYHDICGKPTETIVPLLKNPEGVTNVDMKIRSFLDAIKNGTPSPIPSSQIIINQAIIDGIVKSSEVGHEIEITIPEV